MRITHYYFSNFKLTGIYSVPTTYKTLNQYDWEIKDYMTVMLHMVS